MSTQRRCVAVSLFMLAVTYAQVETGQAAAGAVPPSGKGVVRIFNHKSDEICLGSGTVVGSEQGVGVVLTCAHLFTEGVGDLLIVSPEVRPIRAVLVAIDEENDLACLVVHRPSTAVVSIAQRLPDPGAPLASCGFGTEGAFRVNRGVQLGYATLSGGQSLGVLEMSGEARQGDSGGPILSAGGDLVGVIMGTDGNTVDGTHCGRILNFLSEHPVTTSLAAEAKQLSTRPVEGLAHFFRATYTDVLRDRAVHATTTVRGRVRFDRQPVRDATVHLSGAKSSVTTVDDQGRFLFHDLPPGNYRVDVDVVIKNRVRQATQTVRVSAVATRSEIELQVE